MVFSKLCHGPSASGDKGISLTPRKSARGKFDQIGNKKRACVQQTITVYRLAINGLLGDSSCLAGLWEGISRLASILADHEKPGGY